MWHAARILILGLLCWNLVWAETMPRGPVRGGGGSLDVANPNVDSRLLDNGYAPFVLTNYGTFGGWYSGYYDECEGGWVQHMEFEPGESRYSLGGALWIGATIVEEGNEFERVSVGMDGWFSPSINEFYPGEGEENGIVFRSNIPGAEDCFGNLIFDPEADANIEAIAVYSDTLMDWFWLVEDPVDGDHRPLGLEITQTAKSWTSADFGKFVILDFHIENIGENFLKNLSLGVYAELFDADIAGSIVEDTLTGNLISWVADQDGWLPGEPAEFYPHCSGIAALKVGDNTEFTNYARGFNWWVSNSDPNLDYGPSWTDSPEWMTTIGTPVGDEHKAELLASRQRDFDVLRVPGDPAPQVDDDFPCISDGLTHNWRGAEGASSVRPLAGFGSLGIFDYQDQFGHCVYRLNPGESFDFTMALLIGENLHDPENPQEPPIDPSLFSFDGLRESMSRARMLYEDGSDWQPPTPVTNLRVEDAMDAAVPLLWNEPLVGGHAGYRIYGRPNGGEGERVPFTPGGVVPQLDYTVEGLTNGDVWLFEVETWDGAGYRSAMASRLVAVGAIPDDLYLSGSVEGNDITITWNAVEDPTLSNYLVMRRSSEFDSTSFVVSGTEQHYVDADVVSGRTYTYWVRAENSFGFPGLNSDSLALTGFAPTGNILVFDETKTPTPVDLQRGAISADSIRAYYESLLTASGESYAYYDRLEGDSLPTLEEMGQYEMMIWHHENPTAADMFPNAVTRAELQSSYVEIGGKLIRMGRQTLNSSFGYTALVRSNFGTRLEPLSFDSLFASLAHSSMAPHNSTRTTRVISLDSDFPPIAWDQVRVAQMRYFNQPVEFLPEIDLFWPNGNAWPLYSVVLHESDTLHTDGAPCAVIGPGVIQFGFPLYFVPPTEAAQLLTEAIEALRTQELGAPKPAEPLPEKIALLQNYPNPFNAMTMIEFELPSSQVGALRIYNITGQLVETLQNGLLEAGTHREMFDASGLASGLYFYRLELAQQSVTRKMLLLK